MRRAALLFALVAMALFADAVPARAQRAAPQSREEIQLSFSPIVKRAAPAVVNILTKRQVRSQLPSALFNDPFFRRFFGDQFPGGPQGRVQNSLGSGVIVDPSGVVVTNNHVIRGSDEITIVLADRREFEAKILRADERTDLAVLKIDAGTERLPALEFRDSDELEVGDLVLAIGNPFGVGQTVTMGIVSALARTTVGITDYRFFIQTDAAINPGNSGGALLALDGRLVGINTAIYSRDGGGSIGIGFAVPSNMVRTVVAGAGAGQKLVRPWFGAGGQTVTAEIASSLGLPRPYGVLLNDIHAGGPAERAGARRGDVVTRIDGKEVQDVESLRYRVATYAIGSNVSIGLWREGRERNVAMSLVAPPETPPRDTTPLRGNHVLAGATIANLSPALVEELDIDLPPRGVVVTEVRRDSSAARLRLQPGDILLRINDRALGTTEDVRRALSLPLPWRIQVRRGDQVLNTTVGG